MGGDTSKRIYPKANITAQWYENLFSRATFSIIEKFLLHTTETTGWPGYSDGASAPTITYHPRQGAFRQHNFLNTSARALVDPTSTVVRENRDNVVQLEIICYSDRELAQKTGGLWVGDLTDTHYSEIAELIAYVRAGYGGPPLQYPSRSDPRMTGPEYDAFKGILGHDDASGNTHWDPGAFNFAKLIQFIQEIEGDFEVITDADLARIAAAVWNKQIEHPNPEAEVKTIAAGRSLTATNYWAWRATVNVIETAAQDAARDAALASAVAQIEQNGTVNLDEVKAAAKAGAQEALDGYSLKLEPPTTSEPTA